MEGKEKIVLKDGTEIEIENGAVENCIQVVIQNLDGFKELYGKFSEENLENYTVQNVAGMICATYENKHMKNAIVEQRENGFLVSVNLADVDMIRKRLEKLEAGQAILDGAITDLGDVVSVMAEGGEV